MDSHAHLPAHGGDVAAVAARYGTAHDLASWIDFSANVNPNGPPEAALAALRAGVEDIAALARYPAARDRALRDALASSLNLDADRVVVANGAAALIDAFVRTVVPRRCVVPQPAFSEYARALAAVGCETIALPLDPANGFALDVDAMLTVLERERPHACILTNPHNPSGGLTDATAMRVLLDAAKAFGVAMLIDEAFIDYVPGASVARYANDGNVLIVRSLTKFYAMPALRVGYALAPPPFARAVHAQIPSWPISALAADAAIAVLGDTAYAHETRATNECERTRLEEGLRAIGLRVVPSSANFVLFEAPLPSAVLTDALARNHRLVVRDCSTYATLEHGGYIRVGVRSRADNDMLLAALAREMSLLASHETAQ